MKKIYTIITTLLLAVLTANAQTVLINEDFSGLTAGTEDNPDATMLVDDMGDFINPSALKPYDSGLSYKKWGGIGLYSAGGCIAIKDGWFLNTPAGDMSGDVTITFRARLAKGQDDTGRNALDLIFLSRKGLVDFGRKTYSLTEEWQSFSFSSDKGNFETTGFQFFANTEATILLDDVRVERKQKSIQTPTAQDAENITDHSFRAVWTPTGAESYLLNVYSKKESGNTITVSEDFEAVDADSEGRLNATNPNLPEGWSFEWKDLTKPHVAIGEGPDGSTKAIRLVDEGDNTAVLFDNVTYAYPEPAELTYALKDLKVAAQKNADAEADMTYDVTGLDPELDYFYTVKAVSGRYVSEPSKEIEVFAVSQPTVLEPTDITSDGYTANWTCGNKVDVYRVEQVQLNTIDKDTDDYTILYEDFSKVKAGDKVEVVTSSVITDNNTTKSMYMDRPNFGPGHDIYYRVTGLRYYHGNRKDAVASSPSDMMLVKAPATSIQTVGKTGSSVTTVAGGVSVTTADNAVLDVFTVTGQKALTRTLAPGTTDVSLAPGVYIIKVADQTVRVVVR